MTVHGAANELGHPRLGVIVTRRMGGAVKRNRWKRLLREAFRLSQGELPALDFVCIARAEKPPPLTELKSSLVQLASRIESRITGAAQRPLRKSP
jgi:ribonuclease P protein component